MHINIVRICKALDININLTKKISVVFCNYQNYDSHLMFEESKSYNFKINVIPKTIEKYMTFSIELNKVVTIDRENS